MLVKKVSFENPWMKVTNTAATFSICQFQQSDLWGLLSFLGVIIWVCHLVKIDWVLSRIYSVDCYLHLCVEWFSYFVIFLLRNLIIFCHLAFPRPGNARWGQEYCQSGQATMDGGCIEVQYVYIQPESILISRYIVREPSKTRWYSWNNSIQHLNVARKIRPWGRTQPVQIRRHWGNI